MSSVLDLFGLFLLRHCIFATSSQRFSFDFDFSEWNSASLLEKHMFRNSNRMNRTTIDAIKLNKNRETSFIQRKVKTECPFSIVNNDYLRRFICIIRTNHDKLWFTLNGRYHVDIFCECKCQWNHKEETFKTSRVFSIPNITK